MKISEETERYLRRKQWSMGNGQCEECCGLRPDKEWHYWNPVTKEVRYEYDQMGHDKKCRFAKLMKELGIDVVYAERKRT
jgi:hypothetical protein